MLFDTHAHLLEATPQEVAALHYPVLNVTTDSSQWSDAVELSKQSPMVACALGLHPWFVCEDSFPALVTLENYLQREKICALGEIGLDFQKQFSANKDLQLEVFESQLQLAQKYLLPVSIHVIKAHNEMLALIKEYPVSGVIHGLGASLPLVKSYIDLGFKVGVNGVVCRENANRYHAMLQNFDLRHFVLETDYPNIALPGQNNVSLNDINRVAETVASLKNSPLEEVLLQTGYNAQQIFRFSQD
ncbi:TatD family hydrolase [Thiomicrorhabdus xiamenensis]|uniref:TatD family hydrolase n=1 Tax=Thiomicrorhabdus xiamenensis TaxID=2739063 RepID=A0A7D4NQ28_9GAMM|nr:TatD family hydrolase [Thiomicrorhabdus xiamenensis]QKI88452.1 TatD family hydrolase [Thiomicrorhabdus xiamenensis]